MGTITLPAKRGRPPRPPRSFLPQDLPEYIDVPTAAKRLCVQRRTLLNAVREGKLRAYKPFHNKVLLELRPLMEWLESTRMVATKEAQG